MISGNKRCTTVAHTNDPERKAGSLSRAISDTGGRIVRGRSTPRFVSFGSVRCSNGNGGVREAVCEGDVALFVRHDNAVLGAVSGNLPVIL